MSIILPLRADQIRDFLAHHEFADAQLHPLAGDASFRRYIRVKKGNRHAMLMDAPPEKENVRPYMKMAEYLCQHGYSAPKILAADPASGFLLLEDLGDDSYTAVLRREAGGDVAQARELYGAAIDLLAEWHGRKTEMQISGLSLPAYDEGLLMQEVNLFCDWYLPQVVGKEMAVPLRNEYRAIWQELLAKNPLATDMLVHRDYHADNLMWLPERKGVARVGLLDFQDGVWGDAAYDLVSLLEDARRDVPDALAQEMLSRYIAHAGVDRERFMAAYALLGAQRNSKIIGIFVRLGARDGKYHYLDYLPRVWKHLERDLAHPALKPLKDWLDKRVTGEWRGIITVRHTSQDLALTA